MSEQAPVVFVVDDDASVREALDSMLRSVGWQVETFASALEFLARAEVKAAHCLVLDVQLPGLSGLDLQRTMADAHRTTPIIFLTGNGDIPMTVRAMKAGAVEFLTKPFFEQELLESISRALAASRSMQLADAELQLLRTAYASLTNRQREVMQLVITGLSNKQVAGELGLSEITIKVNRGQVSQKMGAKSFAELVRMAGKLELHQD